MNDKFNSVNVFGIMGRCEDLPVRQMIQYMSQRNDGDIFCVICDLSTSLVNEHCKLHVQFGF